MSSTKKKKADILDYRFKDGDTVGLYGKEYRVYRADPFNNVPFPHFYLGAARIDITVTSVEVLGLIILQGVDPIEFDASIEWAGGPDSIGYERYEFITKHDQSIDGRKFHFTEVIE